MRDANGSAHFFSHWQYRAVPMSLLSFVLCACQALHMERPHPSTDFRDEPHHLSEQTRADLYTIAMTPIESTPVLYAEGPDYGKQGGEAKGGAAAGAQASVQMVLDDPRTLIVLPLILPVMVATGSVTGVVVAKLRKERKKAVDKMLAESEDPVPNVALAQEISRRLTKATDYEVLVEPTPRPETGEELFELGADSELKVGVNDVTIYVQGDDATIGVQVQAILYALPQRQIVSQEIYAYEQTEPVRRWRADEGSLWKRYLQDAKYLIARQIVDDLFFQLELRHVLRPVETATMDGAMARSATPTLSWEFVLLGHDDHLSSPVTIDEEQITFDVEIYFDDGPVAYRRTGLTTTSHMVEEPLKDCTKYRWTVRPNYVIEDKYRVGEWMIERPSFLEMASPDPTRTDGLRNVNAPDDLHSFRTVCPDGADG